MRMLIAVIAATGLNILTGFTGQISLGNAAFLAVGAYATAFLAGRLGLPFPVVIPVAGLVTALVGMVFGVPSLRLKGLYLAVATLAAHFVVEFTAVHWESVTGGVNGISVPAAKLGPLELDGDRPLFFLSSRSPPSCSSSRRTCSAPRSARPSSPSATRTSPPR